MPPWHRPRIPETRRAAPRAGPPWRRPTPARNSGVARAPSKVMPGIHEGEARMRLQVLPYVTVEIDDRLRRRLRRANDRLRVNVRAYLLSAADDVDAAGDRVRDLCDRAVNRVDSVVERVNDRIGADEPPQPHLHLVGGREAS